METKIKVKIEYIFVSKQGIYSFDWYLFVNGKRKNYGNYDGTFSGRSVEAFRKVLKRGWAVALVLQREF